MGDFKDTVGKDSVEGFKGMGSFTSGLCMNQGHKMTDPTGQSVIGTRFSILDEWRVMMCTIVCICNVEEDSIKLLEKIEKMRNSDKLSKCKRIFL